MVIAMASMNCYTSCEDECKKTEMDAKTVDIYAWGTIVFLNNNQEDVTEQYVGTRFRISYNKQYCRGKTGQDLGFDYLSLANGSMEKDGIGSYSVTMQNELDFINFITAYIDPNGEEKWLNATVALKKQWDPGQVRLEIKYTVHVRDDGGFIDLDIDTDFNFLDPI